MSEHPEESKVYVDTAIGVGGPISPGAEDHLAKALTGKPGIVECVVGHGKLDLRYEPTVVTKSEIIQQIHAVGFQVDDVQSAPSSLVTDAILADDPGAPP